MSNFVIFISGTSSTSTRQPTFVQRPPMLKLKSTSIAQQQPSESLNSAILVAQLSEYQEQISDCLDAAEELQAKMYKYRQNAKDNNIELDKDVVDSLRMDINGYEARAEELRQKMEQLCNVMKDKEASDAAVAAGCRISLL
jgi:uncharacterized coiled-coil DUF342 family protein